MALSVTPTCQRQCGDIHEDGAVNLVDFAAFTLCFGLDPMSSPNCLCSDLNADGLANLTDFATFSLLFGGTSTNVPPNCP